jgi:hypothetical protein
MNLFKPTTVVPGVFTEKFADYRRQSLESTVVTERVQLSKNSKVAPARDGAELEITSVCDVEGIVPNSQAGKPHLSTFFRTIRAQPNDSKGNATCAS